jgi:hypothetical protein
MSGSLADLYNTPLTPVGEDLYRRQFDPQASADYDMRGAWAQLGGQVPQGVHLTDQFKKPNHPTFSTGSQYATGDQQGGHWIELPTGQWAFMPSPTNLSNFGQQNLQRYFDKVEPGNLLLTPPPGGS